MAKQIKLKEADNVFLSEMLGRQSAHDIVFAITNDIGYMGTHYQITPFQVIKVYKYLIEKKYINE